MPEAALTPSALLGRPDPRLSTAPLRPLTPETSRGFEFARFADEVLGEPLLPWQREAAVRALELRPDGRYRFRTVVILVARQNGKTHLLRTLALWRMFMDGAQLVLSCAQSLDIAREAWQAGVAAARGNDDLSREVDNVRFANGEQCLTLTSGARWRIAAASRSAGRGLSVDLLVLDELREHRTWDAWSALSKTTTARRNGMTFCISNAGDDESVVLNHLRESALAGADDSLGLFEWSAPDGCALDDRAGWAQANPGLGHTVPVDAIVSALSTDPPGVFRTEVLCQRVQALDFAVSPEAWEACRDPSGSLTGEARARVVACFDVAPDGGHAVLVAASIMGDGRVWVETVAEWDTAAGFRDGHAEWLRRVRPQAVGWFPGGPAAALAVDLRGIPQGREVKAADVPAVCQGFAEQVAARRVVHTGDPMLGSQVAASSKLPAGDGWRFSRRGGGSMAGLYAAAGAVHLARSLPVRRLMVVTPNV